MKTSVIIASVWKIHKSYNSIQNTTETELNICFENCFPIPRNNSTILFVYFDARSNRNFNDINKFIFVKFIAMK